MFSSFFPALIGWYAEEAVLHCSLFKTPVNDNTQRHTPITCGRCRHSESKNVKYRNTVSPPWLFTPSLYNWRALWRGMPSVRVTMLCPERASASRKQFVDSSCSSPTSTTHLARLRYQGKQTHGKRHGVPAGMDRMPARRRQPVQVKDMFRKSLPKMGVGANNSMRNILLLLALFISITPLHPTSKPWPRRRDRRSDSIQSFRSPSPAPPPNTMDQDS